MSFVKYTNDEEILDIVNILIKSKNDEIGDLLYDILIRLIKYNKSIEGIKLLLQDARLDISKDEDRAIAYAAEMGVTKIVKLLMLDNRVDPNRGWTLQFASENGHTEIVELLLIDGRADPALKNNSAIISACNNNHLDVVKVLLKDKRVTPNVHNNIILQDACKNSNFEMVKLLSRDYRINPSDLNNLAFQTTCYCGNLDIVKLLLGMKESYLIIKHFKMLVIEDILKLLNYY